MFIVSGTSTGYSLFANSTSVFLQLAALYPELWSANGTISISEAVRVRQFEIKNFVFHDTVTALTLGVSPLIHYDTTSSWADEMKPRHIEWIYGFPVGILLLLAKINAWRVSQQLGPVAPYCNEWCEIEKRLENWSPAVDHTDDASKDISRLAIQECWRQATLIYLYMVCCFFQTG